MSNPKIGIIKNENMTVEKCFQIGEIMRKRIDRVMLIGKTHFIHKERKDRATLIIFKLHFQMMKLSKIVFELEPEMCDEFNNHFELGFLGGKKRKS